MSLCKTLAHKGKTTKRQIMKKYGGRVLTFKYGINQKKEITIPRYGGHTRDIMAFKTNKAIENIDPIPRRFMSDTATWLRAGICGLCGKRGYTEMHHVKHIRRRGHKYKGFERVLRNINRKQVPLCLSCHWRVHNGLYNGISVKEASKQFYKNLGFSRWKDRENGLSKETNK